MNFLEGKNLKSIKIFIYALLFFLVFLILFIYIFNSLRAVFSQLPIVSPGEGFVLNYSMLLHQYGNYYFDINNYPYIYGNYPPLYPFILSIFLFFFRPSFFWGRLISVIATMVIVVILYKIFSSNTKSKFFPFILSALFLGPYFVVIWSSLVRVDMLGIMLSILGLYVYEKYNNKNSKLKYISIIFFILSFYTKQTLIAAPISIIIYNFFKNKREFYIFSSLYAIPLLSIFIVGTIITHGQLFLHLVVYAMFIPLEWGKFFITFQQFFKMFAVLLALFLSNIFIWKKNGIYSIYCIVNLVLLTSYLKPGSSYNYFIEPFLSLLIIGGLSFLESFKKLSSDVIKVFLLIVLSIQIFLIIPFDRFQNLLKDPHYPEGYSENSIVNAYVEKTDGLILSQDISYLVLNNKKPVILNDTFQFMKMSKYGLWDNSEILRMCNEEKFSLIVAGWMMSGIEGMNECLLNHYEIVKELVNYKLYFPRIDIK